MTSTDDAPRSGWRSRGNRAVGGTLVTSGLTQLFLIVSGVLVARSLGPEDRGNLALLVVVSGICYLLGSLGLPTAATYYIAQDRSHAPDVAAVLRRPGILLTIAALAAQVLLLVALVAHDPADVKLAALISVLLVPGFFAFGFGLAILQGQERFMAFNVLRVLPTASYILGVLILFVIHEAGLVTIMAAWTGANFVGGLLALGVAVGGLRRVVATTSAPAPPTRSQLTRFGLKSVFGSLSPIDAYRLDQAMVGLFLTPVALGLYVVAQAFGGFARVVGLSVGFVAYPRVASQPDRASARRAMWKYFFLGAGLALCVVGVLEVVVGQLVTLFFGAEFVDATPIARILILGTLFMAARRVLTDGLNGMGHPGLGTIAEVSSWVLLIPLVAALLPPYGVVGVALALTISWGMSLGLLLVCAVFVGTRVPVALRSRWELMRTRGARAFSVRPDFVVVTAAVLASIAAGVGIVVLPSRAALFVVLAVGAVLLFAAARAAVGRATESTRSRWGGGHSSGDALERAWFRRDSGAFRVSRILYYLGVLTLGILTLRAGGQITFSDVLFLFSFLAACVELVAARRPIPIRLPLLLIFGIFVFSFGGLVSTFEAYEPLKSAAVIVRLIVLTLLWFWLGTIVLERIAHVRTAITLWVTSAAVCGAAAVMQTLGGNPVLGGGDLYGRSTGFTSHPNDLGGLTSIAFVPALMLATIPSVSASRRVLSYLLLFLVGGGLVLSGSVGALAAAIVGSLVFLAFQRTTVHSVLAYAALGLCVLSVIGIQVTRGAPNPLQRFNDVTSQEGANGSGSLYERVAIYRVAIQSIEDHPFVGVGLDLVSTTSPFGVVSYQYDVHNIVIGTWYKAGLVGLVGLLIALLAILRSGWTAIARSTSEFERMMAVSLLASAVAFITFAMSEPVIYARFGWIAAALIFSLRAVQTRAVRVARARGFLDNVHPGVAPVGA